MTTALGTEQYVVDAQGNRVAVLLDMAAYVELMEELLDLRAEVRRQRLGAVRHERAPDASIETLRKVLGSIRLTGPVGPIDLFEEEEDTSFTAEHAAGDCDARD